VTLLSRLLSRISAAARFLSGLSTRLAASGLLSGLATGLTTARLLSGLASATGLLLSVVGGRFVVVQARHGTALLSVEEYGKKHAPA
jgi:hypothetical protein